MLSEEWIQRIKTLTFSSVEESSKYSQSLEGGRLNRIGGTGKRVSGMGWWQGGWRADQTQEGVGLVAVAYIEPQPPPIICLSRSTWTFAMPVLCFNQLVRRLDIFSELMRYWGVKICHNQHFFFKMGEGTYGIPCIAMWFWVGIWKE